MRKDREGLVHSFVVALIIVTVSFLIIFGFAIRAGYVSGEDADTHVCRATLITQDATKMAGVLDSPLSTACKRRTIEISDEGVYQVKNSKLLSVMRKVKMPVFVKKGENVIGTLDYDVKGKPVPAEDVIASHFAESLRRCWLRGLEGKTEVFNDRGWEIHNTVCMLCDETNIQLKDSIKPNAMWLSYYLMTTEIPRSSDKMTYEEYLYNMATPDNYRLNFWDETSLSAQKTCLENKDLAQDPRLRDGSYATIFFRDFGTMNKGCMAVAVVPSQQVRRLCEYVAN